ncbi:MAG: hypothetical protein JSV88_01710 [Candidatus Aminicenantes bacterium]|nr:MAG: hypothetical protein JSV88_01710 [Candidatus Aminicenantes bacterium]
MIQIDWRNKQALLLLVVFLLVAFYNLFAQTPKTNHTMDSPNIKRAFWLKLNKDSNHEEIIKRIKHSHISYVYLYVPLFKQIPLERHLRFIRQVQMKCPGTGIYPWIGRVVQSPWVFESKHFSNRLIEFVNTHNLPGLHLDVEPPFGSLGFKYLPQYVYFLQDLKKELIKDGKRVSIALFPAMVKDFYEKSPAKKADLAILADAVDQFVLMMYDTGLTDKAEFLHHMVSHIAFFNGLTENKTNKEIIIGAASYPWHANKKYRWMHDPGVENIETTIGLLKKYLKDNKKKISIDGYALFRYGTTDSSEWEQFLKRR